MIELPQDLPIQAIAAALEGLDVSCVTGVEKAKVGSGRLGCKRGQVLADVGAGVGGGLVTIHGLALGS